LTALKFNGENRHANLAVTIASPYFAITGAGFFCALARKLRHHLDLQINSQIFFFEF
jgi:hypothetical protein